MGQYISAYMINLRTSKWWWPFFRFVVDVVVNNVYQIYNQSHLNPGECRLDVLGLSRAILNAYYRLFTKGFPSTTLFAGSCNLHRHANNL